MYQKIRKKRGIALVITILILVILAGVTIATLKNTNLFDNAIKAKEKSDYASAKEAIELKLSAINADYEMHGNGEEKLQFTADKLCEDDDIEYVHTEGKKEASIAKITLGKNVTKIYTKLKKYKYEFGISENINLATIDGKVVNENNKVTLTGSISFEKDLLKPSETTTATITVKDNESEINYANSKYILTNSATNIGTNDETKYSGGTLSTTGTASITAGSTEGDYYLHVLLKDKAGNKSEIVSGKLEVSAITFNYKATGMVEYDAGSWTKEEIDELKSLNLYNINISKVANGNAGLDFTFGGFTYRGDTENANNIANGAIATSRNKSIAPQSGYGTPTSDGWIVLEWGETSGNKKYVKKLISAGSPENFVYNYNISNDNYRAEYILSGGTRQKDYATYKPRSFDMYIDKSKTNMIEEVHAMTYAEANAADSTIRATGAYYWLASAYNTMALWIVDDSGVIGYNFNECWGVRPVVSLKSGVYVDTNKHDGTGSNKYVLEME